MEVIEAYKPFDIQEIELEQWKHRPLKNNFFELVLIKAGSGTQCINYNEYPYTSGSLFLLPPLKCHSFQIDTPTQFVFLKFTSAFFLTEEDQQGTWFREAAYILSNYNQLPGDIIHDQLDRQHLYTLIDLIAKETRNNRSSSASLIKSFMRSILEVLVRNIKRHSFLENPVTDKQDERIIQLLSYINEHLHQPQLLKVGNLARTFHLSPNYLSEYFRKNTNTSLREYIIKARLKQVEIRLLNSRLSLSEIADELNFTDVSHLSKTFKRYTGMSVRAFKSQGEYQLLKRSAC